MESDAPKVRPRTPLDTAKVINVGVVDFAEALWAQQVPCVHVDWAPPTAEETELEGILERLL